MSLFFHTDKTKEWASHRQIFYIAFLAFTKKAMRFTKKAMWETKKAM